MSGVGSGSAQQPVRRSSRLTTTPTRSSSTSRSTHNNIGEDSSGTSTLSEPRRRTRRTGTTTLGTSDASAPLAPAPLAHDDEEVTVTSERRAIPGVRSTSPARARISPSATTARTTPVPLGEDILTRQARYQYDMDNMEDLKQDNYISYVLKTALWAFQLITTTFLAAIIYIDIHILYRKRRQLLFLLAALIALLALASMFNNIRRPNIVPTPAQPDIPIGVSDQQNFEELKAYIDRVYTKVVDLERSTNQDYEPLINAIVIDTQKQLSEIRYDMRNFQPSNPPAHGETYVTKAYFDSVQVELFRIIGQVEEDIRRLESVDNNVGSITKELHGVSAKIALHSSEIEKLHQYVAKFVTVKELQDALHKEGTTRDLMITEAVGTVARNFDHKIDMLRNELLQQSASRGSVDTTELKRLLESRPTITDIKSSPDLHLWIVEILRREVISSLDTGYIRELVKNTVTEVVASSPPKHVIEGPGLSYVDVVALIDEALRIYDADKIGKPDYALLSAGAGIIHSRTTPSYSRRSWLERLFYRGFSSPPSVILQPDNIPGSCWAFEGERGNVTIRLAHPIVPTAFSLDHISELNAYYLESCPKDFRVWGLKTESDDSPALLGSYKYLKGGRTVQSFPKYNAANDVFPIVMLEILSNYGHPEYTCVYRFRVHG